MTNESADGQLLASDGTPQSTAGKIRSLEEAIDLLVANDRQIAALVARRAVVLDEARQLSESTALGPSVSSARPDATAPVSSQPSVGWNARVTARRELVSSVACALRLPERTAENLIEVSRILMRDLRATHDALSIGDITYRHAETIVDHWLSVPAESTAEFEKIVLAIAPTVTNAQLERRAGRIRERMHPESIVTRHKAAVDRRCVDLSPSRDGMAWLSAHLPATTATAAFNRITDLALHVEGEGEGSTLTQLRADVFADLLVDGFTHDLPVEQTPAHPDIRGINSRPVRSIHRGTGRGILATVHVTVPVMTLLGKSNTPAELEGYGPIDPDTARKLAAGAPSFHRILTHPETGAVLSVGRDSYAVPKDLRRWLIIRDETCRFPGCSRAARRSDIDHSINWEHHGDTQHENLAHLCASHHHLKHQTAWSYTQNSHGRLTWTSPTGHRYATEPAVEFRNETTNPDSTEWQQSDLDGLRAKALRHSGRTTAEILASAERFIPHPDDPPDADPDDPRYFIIHDEAS